MNRNNLDRRIIGVRLKQIREQQGLTAYKVAQIGGISISQVRNIEEARTNYTIDTLFAYLSGCDITQLNLSYKQKNESTSIFIRAKG